MASPAARPVRKPEGRQAKGWGMAFTRKRLLLVLASLLVTGAALYYMLDGLKGQWGGLLRSLREADYLYVALSVALLGGMYALRVLRWKVLLRPVADVPYGVIASATVIGFMSSCVLPFRPGEVVRPYVLHKRGRVPFGDAAGTAMGLERVFDMVGVCWLVLLTWLALRGHAGGGDFLAKLADRGVWLAALTGVGLAGLSVLALWPKLVLRVTEFCLRPLPRGLRRRLLAFAEAITRAMGFLKSPRQVMSAVLLSLGVWMMFPLSTYALARGFGLELPFAGALVIQVCVTVAVALPQAPGFVGVFQVAAMEAAGLFGVAQGAAGAFAMMMWAVNVVPITLVGLAVLRGEGMNLLKVAQASEQAVGAGEEAAA